MHRFSILFLLVCPYCLSSSATYCSGQTTAEPAVKRLVLRQVTVNWDPARISLEAEWNGKLTQQLHVMNWRKSEGSALPRVHVNNDGRMIISGPPDAIFNSLLHGTRTLLVGPSPSEAEYQVDLPPIRLTSIKDRRLSDGRIEVDLSVEGLLPRFQVHAKIVADDPADKRPPKISSPKLDELGRHAITVTLPALKSDAHVVYQLAVSNRDGSRSRTIGLNRVGPRLDRNVPKVAEASPCPAWDSSKLATAKKPGHVTQPKTDGSEGPLGARHRPPTAEQRIDARSLPCSVRVNWETNTIQVAGKLLSESGDQKKYHLVSASTHAGSEERLPPVVRVQRGTLEFEATVDSFREHLVPGTRSLWLVSAQGGVPEYHRVDLPIPALLGASPRKGKSEVAGPVLTLILENLMPQFDIVFSTQLTTEEDEAELPCSRETRVPRLGVGFPRIIDVVAEAESTRVTMQFGPRSGDASDLTYYLYAVQADGSRSATLRVTQEGNTFSKRAAFAQASCPMPIDATTEVPDVEFVEIDEAFEQVKAAGFQPVLFDVQTMRPIDKQNHNGDVVAKQGLQAGTLARVGELCLLGIRVRSRETDLTEITFSDEQRPPDNLPLDVGGPFGFVPVDFTSDKPETGLGDPLDDPFVGNSEVPFTDSADGLLSNPTLDSASNNAIAETPSNQATVGQTMLPISPDPGISIDPTSEPGDDLLTGILKVAMVAVLEHRETAAAPGLLGHTISTAVRRFEATCLRAIQNGSNREIPFTAILGLLTEQLDVAVTDEEQQRAAADFAEFAKRRTDQTHFDFNRNGQMSDDIAIWSLNWLRRQGLYNPAETTQIMSDRLGNVVAFFPSQPIASDWIGTDSLPKVLKDLAGPDKSDVTDPNADSNNMPSKSQSGSTKPNGGDVRVSESSIEIRIPVGAKVVRTSSHPNRVRIPNKVLESTAGDAATVLNDVGLVIAKKGKLFSHDKVIACNPEPGSWVQPQTKVELNVRRMVPDVTKMSADAAQRALGEKEFIVQPEKPNLSYIKSDVVVAQTPEAGTYASPKAKVQLSIKREVPKVEGLRVSEATTLLKEKKFSVSGTVLTLASDIVSKQLPPFRKDEARVFVDPGSAITFVEVETIVPDLAGSSLLNAKELPAARQLLDSRRLGFEFNGPTTDYPQARILKQTPPFGKRIDRSKQKVELSVVVPVPKFSTATTIGTAKQRLIERTLGATLTSRTYQDSDFVLRSRVLAASESQFRSGSVTFVRPRERVEIVVGRRIPSVAKMSWKDGLRTLENAGLDVESPIGTGTHVYRTEPPGQQLIDLRNTVHVYAGIQIPDVRGSEMTAVTRMLSELGLKPVSPRATVVETADASMLGRVFVYDRQNAQNPPGGTIIPKGPDSTVKLETYTYVEERITVPQLVFAPPETRGLPIEDARVKARPLSVRVVNPTIRTLITTNRHLDNRQVVLTQSIQSGKRVRKSEVIDVTVARYIYRSAEIVTYGVLPNELRRTGGTVWTCRISGDRRTIQIGMENGAGKTFAQATGTLIDDRSNFAGERCLTYALQGGPPGFAADGIRVPVDGSGSGSLRIEGAWFDRQATWITFALKRPVFK